jgi:hypothetical protein
MNIIEENKISALNEIQKNLKPVQHFCVDVLKIAPNANIYVLGREVAKYIAFISLGLNPDAIDIPTDTVINEFLNKTKMLTNFSICKGRSVYKFVEMYPNLVVAAVTVYLTTELSKIKNVDEFLAFDGGEKKPSKLKMFFANLFGGAKQQFGQLAEEKATKAADDFLTWLGKETGIGQAEGNTPNSGGQIYFTWKYFPNNPLNAEPQPKREPISKNYLEQVWKPAISKEVDGWNFDLQQRAFPIYFSKIKAGYYKDQKEWAKTVLEDLKKVNDKKAAKGLKNTLTGENSNLLKKAISLLTGK